ncbi:hypothetical protein DMUE_2180 [Dictyocoela muelleri]|nr:hypothetical protein DMUE_2180 [Dictyocoela muelleri]
MNFTFKPEQKPNETKLRVIVVKSGLKNVKIKNKERLALNNPYTSDFPFVLSNSISSNPNFTSNNDANSTKKLNLPKKRKFVNSGAHEKINDFYQSKNFLNPTTLTVPNLSLKIELQNDLLIEKE